MDVFISLSGPKPVYAYACNQSVSVLNLKSKCLHSMQSPIAKFIGQANELVPKYGNISVRSLWECDF